MTWEDELDAAWSAGNDPTELRASIDRIVSGPGVPDGVAHFERAGVEDSTGHPDLAVEGYRRALDAGLDESRARQATIQLASSLRNLGMPEEALALLHAMQTDLGDGLDDAVAVFSALALNDVGRSDDAIAVLIDALAGHLTRYRVSARAYADELRAT